MDDDIIKDKTNKEQLNNEGGCPGENRSAKIDFNDKIDDDNMKLNNCNNENSPSDESKRSSEQTKVDEEKELLIMRLQRAHADFANYKKRIEKNRFQDKIRHQSEIICDLLPIVDNLERALSADYSNIENLIKGIDSITKQFLTILQQKGLLEIQALGNSFNPNCHEAIEQVDISDLPTNTITEVLQKGYMFNDEVIRPSLVKVNIGGSDNE